MSVASLQNTAFNSILLWQLALRYNERVEAGEMTEEEAVERATEEYFERGELCLVYDSGR